MPVKEVFKDWREDTAEVLEQLVKHDWQHMLIDKLVSDEVQRRRIKSVFIVNLQLIKDIYCYLQSKSRSYPYVEARDVHELFITEMGLGRNDRFVRVEINNICLETCVQGQLSRGESLQEREKKMHRCQFFEILIRLSMFLYTNRVVRQTKLQIHAVPVLPGSSYDELTPSQAWYCFVNYILKPFHERKMIMWQKFREEKLWLHEAKMVFTLNEPALKQLFKKYSLPKTHAMDLAAF